MNGKYYLDGPRIDTSSQIFSDSGQNTLIYLDPILSDTGRIECEVGYKAGTPSKTFITTSSGFITIAGNHNTYLTFSVDVILLNLQISLLS